MAIKAIGLIKWLQSGLVQTMVDFFHISKRYSQCGYSASFERLKLRLVQCWNHCSHLADTTGAIQKSLSKANNIFWEFFELLDGM
jgi:hypothetical protein